VPAGGYLLVWADENTGQTRTNGELHVNFKLSAAGEFMAIIDPAGRLIDSVEFGSQADNVSQGRFPNGGAAPYVSMNTPTPGAPNIFGGSGPRLTGIELLLGDQIRFTWTTEVGGRYRVQAKDNLADADWTELTGDITATESTASRTLAVTGLQRFYRIAKLPAN